MSDLPEELVEEILCRVPATSLTKLRSTYKRWNSLLNKKRFTRKHSDTPAKQFLVLMLKKFRVCLMSVNLHHSRPVEVTGELNLIDSPSRLNQFKIYNISHCDGLLLCTNDNYTRLIVWNPCTGETRWIQPINRYDSYALGSYQDNKSGDNSYKILCFDSCASFGTKYQIYEINSSLWRTLDVITLDCNFEFNEWGMSLKGKTYWFASDEKEKHVGIFLVSFYYTREKFERLLLPCQYTSYETASLSVVREEKLSVLLQHKNTTRTEIWVTNKIDETKLVSWSKVLTVDLEPELGTWRDVSFLFDEEKKVLVCCDVNVRDHNKDMLYIVGEENKVRRINFGKPTSDPNLLNYVPSLTRIQQSRSKRKKEKRKKRKRNQV